MSDEDDIPFVIRGDELATLAELLKETVPRIHDPCVDKLEIAVGQTCVVKASYYATLKKSKGPYKVMYTRLDDHQYQWLNRERARHRNRRGVRHSLLGADGPVKTLADFYFESHHCLVRTT
jgi:hypothetical protein